VQILRNEGFRNYVISLNTHHQKIFKMDMTMYGVLSRIRVESFSQRHKTTVVNYTGEANMKFFAHI